MLLEEADSQRQQSLQAENEPDPMEGEQTWPYQEEMDGQDDETDVAPKKMVPKGKYIVINNAQFYLLFFSLVFSTSLVPFGRLLFYIS